MKDIFLRIAGEVFKVPVDLTMQIYGAPFSIRISTEGGIGLNDTWNAISAKLYEHIGISLPDLTNGPWKALLGIDSNTEVLPSVYIGPSQSGSSGASGKASVYLELQLSPPIRIGGTDTYGPFTITLEPDVTIHAIYLGYENGLDFRAKISTPTTTGIKTNGNLLEAESGPPKFQMVSYPFPLPPQKSSSTTLFEFKYLGLGQRVGPRPITNTDDPLNAIFEELETQFTANDPATILKELATNFYHPDRNWFIATHVVIVGWDIKVLFNDPAMYGLRISVPMTPPSPFMGLLFEILYQKLGPNLGVYYGALTLPYFLRRIVLQGIILILPGFSVWIYTNGDFRVHVGWPLGDSSVGIQVGILVGIAGFYFGKLSSGDNPGAQPSVNYNPIIIFGIGLSIYVKQGFSVSVFSATLAVSVTATLQGLLAWRAGNGTSGPPDHYWFAGTAGLSVLIQGTVDFAILKASVVISLQASASIAFETGCMTVIAVSASVSVSVSVKVIFFTIHLSFSASISHQFTIGSGPQARITGPVDPDLSGFVLPSLSREQYQARTFAARFMEHVAMHRGAETAWRMGRAALAAASPQPIDVYFALQPTAVYTTPSPSIQVVASLLMESPSSSSSGSAFELLVDALIDWLVTNYSAPDLPWSTRLAQVAAELGSGGNPPGPAFGGRAGFAAAIDGFLETNVSLQIHGVDGSGSAPFNGPAAVLPMLNTLQLSYANPSPVLVDFSTYNLTPPQYPEAVTAYFEELSWSGGSGTSASGDSVSSPPDSMAGFLLHDYFLLLARRVVGDLVPNAHESEAKAEKQYFERMETAASDHELALDAAAEYVAAISSDAKLSELLKESDYSGAAGIGSRYLLHGLQLPDPAQTPGHPTPDNMRHVPTAGLYVLTGQQFAATAGAVSVSATLSSGPLQSRMFRFATGQGATSTIELPAAVPPPPSPEWQMLSAPPMTLPPGMIVASPLPPLNPQPLYYSLKNRIAWHLNSSNAIRTILTFPDPLVAYLRKMPLLLAVTTKEPQEHLQAVLSGAPRASSDELDSAPALLIRLSLSQVPAESTGAVGASGSPSTGSPANTNSPRFLPFVYQLGGTDEQTRDLIDDALNLDLSQASIHLLFAASNGSTLASDELSQNVLVAKTNLSTLNQVAESGSVHFLRAMALTGEPGDFAPVTDVRNFLRLIWEVSIVNAPGYFLFYQSASGQDLPADLFATQGVGGNSSQFQIVLSFNQPQQQAQLSKAQNCVWIDQATQPDTTLYGAVYDRNGQPLPQYSPTYPPGSLAYGIEWTQTPVSPPPPIPVDDLYQLIQYSVLPQGGYFGSSWSLPAGPADNSTNPLFGLARSSSDWQYTINLPISRFFGPPSPANDDPYAMIGSPVTVAFRLDDLYGNPLPDAHAASVLPQYNDPLIGIGEWPGVQTHYHFEPASGQAAALVITAVFDPESLTPQVFSPSGSDASPQEQWQAVLDRYGLIASQLADPATRVSVTCSLSGGTAGDPAKILMELQAFVRMIEAQVLLAISNCAVTEAYESGPQPVQVSLAIFIPFAAVRALPRDIVQIGVSIIFERDTAFIDPEVRQRLPSVASITWSPSADLQLGAGSPAGSPSTAGGLSAFAAIFEVAFQGFDGASGQLKLAQTSGIQTASNSGETAPLWAVRWSRQYGIALSFREGGVTYFALRPLSTSLISRLSLSTGLSYNNVDLDEWAYEFLRTADAFLSPKNAVAVAILDLLNGTNYFNDLMTYKESLAASIPEGLAHLLVNQSEEGNLAEARERLQQSLLTSLSSAFSISTIAQADAIVSAAGPESLGSPGTQPAQVYGSVGPLDTGSPSAEPRQYTLSAGELDLLPGVNRMTVLVSVANAQAQSELVLPLWYEVSYLQHNFGVEVDGYVPSSWVKFILPGAPPLICPITGNDGAHIPISLPFYPSLPILQSQLASGVDLTSPPIYSSPDTVENEIADLLRWQYAVELQHRWAAQDNLYVTVTFNKPVGSDDDKFFRGNTKETLFDALAYFRQQYDSIAGELGVIPQEGYPGPAAASPGRAADVIHIFAEAMHRVAEAWKTYWMPSFGSLAAFGSEVISEYFYLQEDGPVLTLRGRTEGGENPPYWPSITAESNGESWSPDRTKAKPPEIPGGWWTLEHGFARGTSFNALTLVWKPLNVLERQTATLSSWVVRNADLVGDSQPVNPAFIYKTAEVEFPGALVPLIQRGAISPLQPASSLTKTLVEILTPMALLGASMNPYLRISATYEFDLAAPANGGPALTSSIAILLADGIQLAGSGAVGRVAESLAEELAEWYLRMQPSTANAMLAFSISVFGTVKNQELPLVQIARVPVVIRAAYSWWTGSAK